MKQLSTILLSIFFLHTSAQNVGVGTKTPIVKLHVVDSTSSVDAYIHSINQNNNAAIRLITGPISPTPAVFNIEKRQQGEGFVNIINATNGDIVLSTLSNNALKFKTTDLERMRIMDNGNIGIGTTTPTDKLQVAGDVNFGGQLKANGNAGSTNQVLMKDGSNNLIWGDLSDYKNSIQYNCNQYTQGSAFNCSATFTVPANVTSVFVETWGGGGGGFNVSGGGSGGYASAKIPVIAGQVINLSIGAGGYGSGIFSPAYNGGNTTITTAAITVTAGGGFAAQSGSIFTNNSETYIAPVGGTFSFAGLSKDYYGVKGNVGFLSKINFVHVNDTEFAKVYEFGNGGDAPFFPNSGGKGGYNFVSTTYNYRGLATIFPSIPGAGGAADINSSSKYGAPGMVIVRW